MTSFLSLQSLLIFFGILTLFYIIVSKYFGIKRANLMIAAVVFLGLPLAGFYFTKKFTSDNIKMPVKYYSDGVNDAVVDGKKMNDTLWHKVKNLTLVNQYGDTTTLDSLKGKVLIVNFFFTHCTTICPTLTRNLKKVQSAIVGDSGMHMISITVDPKRDSAKVLRDYALKNNINHDNWWLCKIINDTLENVMMKEFKSGFQNDSVIEIIHSPEVYILDKKRILRGKQIQSEFTPEEVVNGKIVTPIFNKENPSGKRFYDGKDTADLLKLIEDAGLVKMEKAQKGKPPIGLLITSLVIMGLVFLWLTFMNKKKPLVIKEQL
jgi:protein SCO1